MVAICVLRKRQNTRQGFFEPDEITRVISHLPAYLQDAVRFAYHKGWRKTELFTLTWNDVDTKAGVIRLRATQSKNKTGRRLAIEGTLETIIQRRHHERVTNHDGEPPIISTFVFHHDGHRIVDIKRAWTTACEKAGVGKKLFHDLRRTATWYEPESPKASP